MSGGNVDGVTISFLGTVISISPLIAYSFGWLGYESTVVALIAFAIIEIRELRR